MKAEQTVERYLCKQVKQLGGLCIKLTGTNGIPDRLCVFPGGRCVFIELKTDGGRLSPIQVAIHRRLRSMGCECYTLWSADMVNRFIDYVNKG